MLSKNQIREIQSLQLKKFRDSKKVFIAEGVKTVSEVLEFKPGLVNEVFGTEEFIGSKMQQIKSNDIKFTIVTGEELKKISLQATPNNAMAVCDYFTDSPVTFDFDNHFSFYLDDVRDPGNLGTIIRLADWFGISTVFCSLQSCDLYNPKVIQSTMGAFLRVNIVYTELPELVAKFGIKTIYGGFLDGKNIYGEQLQNGLIVIGNEANGIHDDNLKHITTRVTIPSVHSSGTESLNAAMAAAIMVSEFYRQLKVGVSPVRR